MRISRRKSCDWVAPIQDKKMKKKEKINLLLLINVANAERECYNALCWTPSMSNSTLTMEPPIAKFYMNYDIHNENTNVHDL